MLNDSQLNIHDHSNSESVTAECYRVPRTLFVIEKRVVQKQKYI